MVSTQVGDAPRIENTGSTSWKPLRSSSGHALDDDDDKRFYVFLGTCFYVWAFFLSVFF